jgi:hypothetical protein
MDLVERVRAARSAYDECAAVCAGAFHEIRRQPKHLPALIFNVAYNPHNTFLLTMIWSSISGKLQRIMQQMALTALEQAASIDQCIEEAEGVWRSAVVRAEAKQANMLQMAQDAIDEVSHIKQALGEVGLACMHAPWMLLSSIVHMQLPCIAGSSTAAVPAHHPYNSITSLQAQEQQSPASAMTATTKAQLDHALASLQVRSLARPAAWHHAASCSQCTSQSTTNGLLLTCRCGGSAGTSVHRRWRR